MEVEVEELQQSSSAADDSAAAAVKEGIDRRDCDGGSGDRSSTPARHPSGELVSEEDNNGPKENDGKDDSSHANRKKRCRRKRKAGDHHRVGRWKPYGDLTWEQRQELDEREALRANMKRNKRFASGQPMAPYNTTQFLMEQHDGDDRTPRTPAGYRTTTTSASPGSHGKCRHPSQSGSGEDDSMSDEPSCGFEDSYLERDFIKAYESYRAERLQGMSKDDLIRECLLMEAKIELFQGTMKTLEETVLSQNKLKEENERLVKENELLKIKISIYD